MNVCAMAKPNSHGAMDKRRGEYEKLSFAGELIVLVCPSEAEKLCEKFQDN